MSQATLVADVATTDVAFQPVPGMSITLDGAIGQSLDVLATVSALVVSQAGAGIGQGLFALRHNGVLVPGGMQSDTVSPGADTQNRALTGALQRQLPVTVAGAQTVDLMWRVTAANVQMQILAALQSDRYHASLIGYTVTPP